jgi:hypothetical protein
MRFIPANVDEGARSQSRQFPDHIINEFVSDFIFGAQGAETHFGTCVQFPGFAITVQFGISSQGGIGVPRHVDFRNDGDVAIQGVLHDVLVLFLGVVATFAAADLGFTAMLGQLGPGFDLDAPALIVRQVQVHGVHFVGRNQVDETFGVFHTKEMPGHIKHGASHGIGWKITNGTTGDAPGAFLFAAGFHLSWQQLPDGLNTHK